MDFANPPLIFVLVDGLLAPRIFRSLYRRYADSIALHGDESVLDFACGSGGIAEHLAPRLPRGTLTCVDISPPMLAIAARRLRKYENVRCLLGRIGELGLAEESFDAIVVHNGLHDIPEPERSSTVLTLSLLLRPGGRLTFREPTDPRHGLPADGYRKLMQSAALRELHGREAKVFPAGRMFDAGFAKDP